ncbi:uncharacterized protein LOC133039744 [Cannabis sativa]|uniref:uncharacterized protein LOC133039744 n=1 Tax=Cannabis sativa TaxID=3483 RepID=UPI0029CA53C6|nr:uncharacterized protein LOC133039744 [Cannabis sativa]
MGLRHVDINGHVNVICRCSTVQEWSAFLSDQLIFDNIFIAQEMIHAISHRKLVSIQFNINGNISKEIFPSQGLRQGDPLSPYLFLLCSEGLSAALCIQQRLGNFKGISIARSTPVISHLLFADDTLLFSKATQLSYNALKAALQLYNQAIGQQVNFGKSSILFSPNTPSHVSDYFYNNIGLANKPFMSKYLGVPQCFGRSKKSSFNFILNRVSSHLNVWNNKFFSKAGKEVVLKAVIQAIPSYVMSCYKIPASICQKIEKLMAQFWWGSFGKKSKTHWKSWSLLCNSKFFGGLGFRSLIHHNQALLAKQAWRVFTTPDSLATRVLKARYFKNSSFLDATKGSYRGNNKTDCLIWKGDPSGLLTVKSAYHFVNTVSLPPSSSNIGFYNNAEELVQWTSSYLLEYKTSQSKRIDVASTCHSHATAKQNQSSEGSYQLYTDAAINIRNSKIGLGAVVKDWNEKVIAGFSLPILAQATPIMAEAMALESALIWCYNIRIPLANIYTDSKQLASKINSPKKELSALADVIEDIKSFLSYIPNVSVHFLPRDCNTHAHHMAKEALGLDEELVWNDIHPNLSIVT